VNIGYGNRGKHEEARLYGQAAEYYRRTLDRKENETSATQPFKKEMLLHALED
jgi:hypothetical protein